MAWLFESTRDAQSWVDLSVRKQGRPERCNMREAEDGHGDMLEGSCLSIHRTMLPGVTDLPWPLSRVHRLGVD
jgi:hypothetical protein